MSSTTIPSKIPPEPLPLWPDDAVPGGLGGADAADIPAITVYSPTGPNNGAAVVVCPGGGYQVHAPHEAEPVARWLNSLGATGIVLRYRLGPRYRHPAMLHDAARAIRTVRAHGGEWGIDPARIGVLGFSAGGHLASTISNHYDAGQPDAADPIERVSSRPDASILIYPVITFGEGGHVGSRNNLLGENPDPELVALLSNHLRVTPQTPPTFLVHSTDDSGVPVGNSLRYALALEAAGVPFAMQIYNTGAHGYGMGRAADPITSSWPDQCGLWLRSIGFLGEERYATDMSK